MFRAYKAMNSKIHAPEELKKRVLDAAHDQAPRKENRKPGLYVKKTAKRRWSVLQKAAVVALLLIVLPVSAYAAAKQMGLMDYLTWRKFTKVDEAQELITKIEQPTQAAETSPSAKAATEPAIVLGEHHDEVADYRVLEVLCDSDVLCMVGEVRPVKEEYFLIPTILDGSESAGSLGIEGAGANGETVEEYVASLGKIPAYAMLYMDKINGEDFNGAGYWTVSAPDGSFRVYADTRNTSGVKEFTLGCTGISYGKNGNLEYTQENKNRMEFSEQITDNSQTTQEVFTTFDERIAQETGFHMQSLTIRHTQIGTYADFRYTVDTPMEFYDIRLVDSEGNILPTMPVGGGPTAEEQADGTMLSTAEHQRLDTLEGVFFEIYSPSTGTHYGPYSFGK